jgi:hypothetical protein
MATIEVSGSDLLKALRQLGPEELDAFLEQALALRKAPPANTLSAQESKLIQRINRGVPADLCRRYERLLRKRQKRVLTDDEHEALLKLTHEMESRDAQRAAALVELAKLRRVPLRILMSQMGIEAAPLDG